MEFECRGTPEGRLEFGPYNRARFQQYLKDHGPIRLKITPELPESGRLRRYFEAALVGLVCFYQENLDHRNSEHRRIVREWCKAEFNSDWVVIGGSSRKVPMSSKGQVALRRVVEGAIEWLEENYVPPPEALDVERFKRWRDTVFPSSGPNDPDNYIDYLVSINVLKPKEI